MTTTQRKPSQQQQQIQLAPNQIYIKRPDCPDPIQTVIKGCPGWSYVEHAYIQRVSLFYQGRCILSLMHKNGRYETDTYGLQGETPVCYQSLAEAAQSYAREHETYLRLLVQLNQEDGFEEWCLTQSFATAPLELHLTLPQSVCQRIERVVEATLYSGLEEFVANAIYAHLPELEQRYCSSVTDTEAGK